MLSFRRRLVLTTLPMYARQIPLHHRLVRARAGRSTTTLAVLHTPVIKSIPMGSQACINELQKIHSATAKLCAMSIRRALRLISSAQIARCSVGSRAQSVIPVLSQPTWHHRRSLQRSVLARQFHQHLQTRLFQHGLEHGPPIQITLARGHLPAKRAVQAALSHQLRPARERVRVRLRPLQQRQRRRLPMPSLVPLTTERT